MKNKLIYIVDDEQNIRDLIKTYLRQEGYDVLAFASGDEAYGSFLRDAPDMLVIDLMMPGMDGYSLCREIRKVSEVPIIMVSAKDDEIDRVLGLELGGDDYISKPFSPRELVARVKTIFRRVKDSPEEKTEKNGVRCGDIVIIPEERNVSRDGANIELTMREFDFLYYLARNKNRVFTREQLINELWGYDYIGESRAIDDLVKRVRRKLTEAGSSLEIATVWGYGYKIVDQ